MQSSSIFLQVTNLLLRYLAYMYLISPNISLLFLEFRVVKQNLLSFTATRKQLKSKNNNETTNFTVKLAKCLKISLEVMVLGNLYKSLAVFALNEKRPRICSRF